MVMRDWGMRDGAAPDGPIAVVRRTPPPTLPPYPEASLPAPFPRPFWNVLEGGSGGRQA